MKVRALIAGFAVVLLIGLGAHVSAKSSGCDHSPNGVDCDDPRDRCEFRDVDTNGDGQNDTSVCYCQHSGSQPQDIARCD